MSPPAFEGLIITFLGSTVDFHLWRFEIVFSLD